MPITLVQRKEDPFFGDMPRSQKGFLGDAFVQTRYFVDFKCDDCGWKHEAECKLETMPTKVTFEMENAPVRSQKIGEVFVAIPTSMSYERKVDVRPHYIARLLRPIPMSIEAWPATVCKGCVQGDYYTDADEFEFVLENGRIQFEEFRGKKVHAPKPPPVTVVPLPPLPPPPEPPVLEFDEEDEEAPSLCACFVGRA